MRRWPPPVVRAWRRMRELLAPLFGRVTSDLDSAGWMRLIPPLPSWLRRVGPAPVWAPPETTVPPQLLTVPGVWRDPEAERRAFEAEPLHDFPRTHPEGIAALLHHGWHFALPTLPRLMRSFARAKRVWESPPAAVSRPSPEVLTTAIREQAARLGLSAVGFAPYDPKYTTAEFAGRHEQGSVIVCVLEQDWAATQTAPSSRAERAAMTAYGELMERVVALAEFVRRQGVRAQPHDTGGETIAIHYGVEAGLGQLGLNGQLLTPAAGSRARLTIITTDADLVHSGPVDYGIHPICDACQACIRRCPVGAIPKRRREHRGITKAKIKTERCFPVVATVDGCAVCMKVCPIQRYGLEPVRDHFVRTGEVLGKDSDELEGFVWPLDGRHYGAGSKPRIDSHALLNPPGWHFDPTRTAPPSDS